MRNEILSGNFVLPTINRVEESLGKEVANFTSSMISSLWHNFLVNKSPISSAYWCDKLGNPNTFNIIVASLSKAGYIHSRAITERNWLEIELNEDFLLQHVTQQELEDVRKTFKFAKYRMRNTSATSSDLVRNSGKVKKTGLKREGFLAAANTQFSFDLDAMKSNSDAIAKNLTKSMTKIREKYPEMGSSPADYDEVSLDMLQWLQDHPQTFTRGTTFLDSRGRAISSSLGKIANPIGNKDFRSLLVIPEDKRVQATDNGADTIYLFIAELNGYKSSEGCKGDAIEHKRDYGVQCYLSNTLHDLDMEVEDDRSELHENIWLQRLYNELDAYYRVDAMTKELALVTGVFNPDTYEHYWSTPVELDAGASMLQYMAMLLNSKALAEMTNMHGEQLSDPWNVEGLPRNMVKKAATPMLYGSTKTPIELWKSNGMSYTVEHVEAYNKALSEGGLGIADLFKDFILNNCKPQSKMKVTIWNDTFNIECNRFYRVGEETRLYKVYDSETDQVRPVYHTSTAKIPDLDQFKRYFQTLLI